MHRLDKLTVALGAAPITTAVMHRASMLWAEARSAGRPTALDLALDGDVILAAQAQLLSEQRSADVVVATTNVGHLTMFVDARDWTQMSPDVLQ